MLRSLYKLTIVLFIGLFGLTASARDIDEGYDAFQAGNYELAFELLEGPADQGDDFAQYLLGSMLALAPSEHQNIDAAVRWLTLSAEQEVEGPIELSGVILAQSTLGELYYFGNGVTQSYSEAAKWMLLAANNGWELSQFRLGAMYALGDGVDQDIEVAAHWWELSAMQGNVDAQTSLGQYYFEMNDTVAAVHWWSSAAEQGHEGAQLVLGVHYSDANEQTAAFGWFNMAAEQGNAAAQFELGKRLHMGVGTTKDEMEGGIWTKRSAMNGFSSAQRMLGVMYQTGSYILKDKVLAHMWFNIAAANGDPDAFVAREAIERSMTLEDISLAMQLARTCTQSNYQDCD